MFQDKVLLIIAFRNINYLMFVLDYDPNNGLLRKVAFGYFSLQL